VGIGSFPGVMRPGRGVDHTILPSAEVKERVEVYHVVGPCHHGMARTQVADRETASGKEGSCE